MFVRWGGILATWPRLVAIATLVVTGLLVGQVARLEFDTSFESFLDEHHETRVALDRFRDQFGRGEPVVVAVRTPGRIAEPEFLERLAALHADLEERVLYLDRITSLVNVRATRALGDEIEIGELLDDWPETSREREAIEAFVRTSPLYENYLIGDAEGALDWTAIVLEAEVYTSDDAMSEMSDGTVVSLAGFGAPEAEAELRRLNSMDDADMLATVREVIAEHRARGLEIEMAGSLVVGEVVSRTIKSDFGRLLGIAAVAIFALLFCVFRRVSVSVLVLTVVLLALAGTLGLMALCGAPVGFGTQILPAFLLAAGVGYAVHVVTLFRFYLQQSGPVAPSVSARELRGRAIVRTLDHAGPPILLTALTTMGGLLSFIPAELAPIVQLGHFAPIGIALAALYSVVLLPALLVWLPLRFRARGSVRGRSEWIVSRVGLAAAARPGLVMAALVVVLATSIFGITRLRMSHDPVAWLPESSPIHAATGRVDAVLGGASALELMIDANAEGGFRTPDLLARLDRLEHDILRASAEPVVVGTVLGLHDAVKEINQALAGGDPAAYRVPRDADVVAQELILFENSGMDDLEELVDSTYTTAKLTVRVTQADAFYSTPFAWQIEQLARQQFAGVAEVRTTGMYDLKNEVFVNVIGSLEKSYLLAFCVIASLLVVMVGDLRIGLVSLIPNTAPILAAMGMMGLLEIPLGVYTMLVGSIAMGLAVDDTIHMAHSFVRFEREGLAPREAIGRALSTAGVAVLVTSAALVCGFLVFGLATLSALLHFGIVAAAAIVAALVADLVISPALFVWVARRRARGRLEIQPAARPSRAAA